MTKKENKIRIILDTNLWISFLISKRLKRIDTIFNEDRLILIFSEELLEEVIEVTSRKKFKKYFSNEDVEVLLALFDTYGELIEVESIVELCRDEKDNFLLSLAKDSKADYLITGDGDLLTIKKFEHTEIITYTEFGIRIQL
jgi:putative PIN family toxin of toxin-antitoxin system